jgi:hypothetical protein
MLLFKFLDPLVEGGELQAKAFDLRVTVHRTDRLPNTLY